MSISMFTAVAGCQRPEGGDGCGVRDDVDAERGALHLVDRERDAVHRHAALGGDEARELVRHAEAPARRAVLRRRGRRPRRRRRHGPTTRWPPSSSPSRSERSRLTRVPDRPAPERGPATASRPRRRPRTSPGRPRPRSGSSRSRRSRRRCAMDAGIGPRRADHQPHVAGRRRTATISRTVPSAVMMPVNIQASPVAASVSSRRRPARPIGARSAASRRAPPRRTPAPPASRRRPSPPARGTRRSGPPDRRAAVPPQAAAALDQHAGDPAPRRAPSSRPRGSTPGAPPAHLDQPHAGLAQGAPARRDRHPLAAMQEPGRRLARPSRPGARSAACADGCRRPRGSRRSGR